MRKRLLIIGASGHGKVIADIALKLNKWTNISFLDDDESKNMTMGLNIIGKTKDAFKYKDIAEFIVAIGDNKIREKVQCMLTDEELSVTTLIHPNATIGTDVEIDKGSVVMAGVVINSSTRIGKGCIINTSSNIDHDNIIEDFVHISPRVSLAGTVKVGKNNWIGTGSVVSNNIILCPGCLIGAGTLVINDIKEPGTYFGVPARRAF
ncbi:sugar O-acyltransferase, sialic acid O-acetyltransferase NeuD family [Alkalibacterium subtropicum]|uniref:Sugar O-acyltransferase, sialic acid O-acetyltransferase NeuD family n=1 Tax=Alkalibacterium subtropicum TaxID=753702 RepID=A0A1I1GHP9_9LACT|nr:acetyltransferase [Alkalibacterium subtropicum]SFC10792.1 sugar O-acyltransferase, sialic acid O-acetyltransferase NeuD family [Alkalibacterium subtropicum]